MKGIGGAAAFKRKERCSVGREGGEGAVQHARYRREDKRGDRRGGKGTYLHVYLVDEGRKSAFRKKK